MIREIAYYYLPGVPRKNSITGETTAPELGPYVVSIVGGYWRIVDRAEIEIYVKDRHGVEPTRIVMGGESG